MKIYEEEENAMTTSVSSWSRKQTESGIRWRYASDAGRSGHRTILCCHVVWRTDALVMTKWYSMKLAATKAIIIVGDIISWHGKRRRMKMTWRNTKRKYHQHMYMVAIRYYHTKCGGSGNIFFVLLRWNQRLSLLTKPEEEGRRRDQHHDFPQTEWREIAKKI